MAVLVIVGLVLSIAACGALGGRPAILNAIWLPGGDIYYQHQDFDGKWGIARRSKSGSGSDISLAAADAVAGAGCRYITMFVAPDGGLGLQYECDDDDRFLERADSGSFRQVAVLPKGWGNVAVTSGNTMSGLAMKAIPALGSRLCTGIRQVRDGKLGAPFADVSWRGQRYHLSPPGPADCEASENGTAGVLSPEIRRDGSYFTFLMSEPEATASSTTSSSSTITYLWWWPFGTAAPKRVGPALVDVGSVSVDQTRQRVALSSSNGVALLDLKSGELRKVIGGKADLVAFSADGNTIMYANGSDEIVFADVRP
jgi:hypothetical protein